MARYSPYAQTLTATCAAGTWTASTLISRPPGISALSCQAKIALSSYGGATVTVTLQGTNVHPSPSNADWVTVESTTFTTDGSAFLGATKMCDAGPFAYLRLTASNAGGPPGTGSVVGYIQADDA